MPKKNEKFLNKFMSSDSEKQKEDIVIVDSGKKEDMTVSDNEKKNDIIPEKPVKISVSKKKSDKIGVLKLEQIRIDSDTYALLNLYKNYLYCTSGEKVSISEIVRKAIIMYIKKVSPDYFERLKTFLNM